MTAREQAIQAIKEGNSVAVDGVLYTLHGNVDTGAKSLSELPPDEFFVGGNPEARAEVVSNLQKEIEELNKRLASLGDAKEVKATPKAEAPKAEEPKEAKEAKEGK